MKFYSSAMFSSTSSEQTTSLDIKRFFSEFVNAKSAITVLITSVLLSFGRGCTAGVTPEILSDRYARLYHNYDGPACANFNHELAPEACRNGADNAQEASAWGALLMNILALFCNPVVGSLSDIHGRRIMLIISICLSTLSPAVFVMMQMIKPMDPFYYYLANSVGGSINYIAIIFAALSDTIPEEFRAASFALIMAGFYGGFALAPTLPLLMNHFQVSIVSFILSLGAFLFTFGAFSETLPEEIAASYGQDQTMLDENNNTNEDTSSSLQCFWNLLTPPFREAMILNRNMVIRLVALGSFLSAIVYSTDVNLVIFYIENQLNVRDKDIAQMFVVMGILGVAFQAFLLQPMLKCLGEKGLLVVSFVSGTVHNLLYGVARGKAGIYVALSLSQLTKTNYPVLSSIASKGASPNQQGALQGALFAVGALGSAIGPISMQFIYDRTENNPKLGPGTMFLFASFLYFLGTVAVSFIPVESETSGTLSGTDQSENERDDLEEPLLEPDDASVH